MKAAFLLPILMLAATAPAAAQRVEDDHPRYGTVSGDAKKGQIRARKYPGNLYGIEAFGRKKRLSPEAGQDVSRQVALRAAQLALENDREYFGMFSPTVTRTQVETRYVRGIAPSSTWDAVTMPGYATTYVERQIPGTSGYSYQLPRYEGAWTMVKLFTRAEVSRRG